MSHAVGMIEMGTAADLYVPDCTPISLAWTPASGTGYTGNAPTNVVTGLPIDMNLTKTDAATTAGFNRSFWANLSPQQRWLSCVNGEWNITLDYGPMTAAFAAVQSFSRGIAGLGISTNWSVSAGANMFGSINVSVQFDYNLNNIYLPFQEPNLGWTESCRARYSVDVQGDTDVVSGNIYVSDSGIGPGVGAVGPVTFPGFGPMPTQISTARTATGPASCGAFSCTWPVGYTNNVGAVPNGPSSTFTYPYFGPGDYGISGGAGGSAFNDSDISVIDNLDGTELVTSCSLSTYTP